MSQMKDETLPWYYFLTTLVGNSRWPSRMALTSLEVSEESREKTAIGAAVERVP